MFPKGSLKLIYLPGGQSSGSSIIKFTFFSFKYLIVSLILSVSNPNTTLEVLYSSLMNGWIYTPIFSFLIFLSEKLYFIETFYNLAVYLKQQGGIVIIFLFLNSILFLGVEIYHNYSSQIKRNVL